MSSFNSSGKSAIAALTEEVRLTALKCPEGPSPAYSKSDKALPYEIALQRISQFGVGVPTSTNSPQKQEDYDEDQIDEHPTFLQPKHFPKSSTPS